MKKILYIVLILIAIPLIAALFVKKSYSVEKSVVIDKPKAEVFDYIKYVKNQDKFSVWNQLDPHMRKSYTGTDGTVGFVYAWDSDSTNAGSGEQEIKSIEDGKRVDFELRFLEPFESTEQAYFSTEAVADSTTEVKWGFNGHMNYPMNIMMFFMNFEDMIGGDLQTGLDNLKAEMEKD
ncbi:SRPBCC family protein [Marinilongibacter aquaticus]|uniref:SRPBCC family protein n=1 Tax=Marinilongibacter aquaticus TaxID=2975157 RepID=UPI0021BD627D|nr:SRPBCC family protein [Marinilongibacter aquaticus]UBM57952.1 SRPBCC family protein [Marinilongibacter aquaticus]